MSCRARPWQLSTRAGKTSALAAHMLLWAAETFLGQVKYGKVAALKAGWFGFSGVFCFISVVVFLSTGVF